MTPDEAMHRIDALLSHVWMVRTFVKHSEEVEEDDELQQIYRTLYDYMLAVGGSWQQQDAEAYLKQAHKKFRRLKGATDQFAEIQPDVSAHTNFQMAVTSLNTAVKEIGDILEGIRDKG